MWNTLEISESDVQSECSSASFFFNVTATTEISTLSLHDALPIYGPPGGALPGAAAARALRGHQPLDRVRPQPLPPAGPAGCRLPARPHPRGDVHAPGEGPVLVVQGPAALAVPDPDQVPGRGAAPGRAVPRPRVHDEGQLLLRRRRD